MHSRSREVLKSIGKEIFLVRRNFQGYIQLSLYLGELERITHPHQFIDGSRWFHQMIRDLERTTLGA